MWVTSRSRSTRKPDLINEICAPVAEFAGRNARKKVVDDVFEAGMGYRKAVYTPFPQAVPKYPVIDAPNCTFFQKGTCKACEKFCPTGAIDFNQKDEEINLEVGNMILATGWDLFDAKRITQYGYGRLPNVYTSLEFERLSNAAGPTGGDIILRDGKSVPKVVGIVHCVGSRDKNYNEYCSAICCMQSLKFAHLVHEKTGAEVYNFYIDIRTPAKGYEEFYHRLLEEGTHFIRGKVAEITDAVRLPGEEGKTIIQVEDTLTGTNSAYRWIWPSFQSGLNHVTMRKTQAKLFGISCSADGWLIERHPKLDPISTMTEGIYIAGCVQGPKDIPASVVQGAAASARVLGKIQQKEIAIEPIRATINEEGCSGCRICNTMCPFNAIAFIDDLKVSRVNPALCQGCGTCVAACPAGVISGYWILQPANTLPDRGAADAGRRKEEVPTP